MHHLLSSSSSYCFCLIQCHIHYARCFYMSLSCQLSNVNALHVVLLPTEMLRQPAPRVTQSPVFLPFLSFCALDGAGPGLPFSAQVMSLWRSKESRRSKRHPNSKQPSRFSVLAV